jgi:hypothetical protein
MQWVLKALSLGGKAAGINSMQKLSNCSVCFKVAKHSVRAGESILVVTIMGDSAVKITFTLFGQV